MNENKTSTLFQSLRLAQEEITNPKKDTKGHNYKYAQLDQILEIIKPILGKHGLGLIQTPTGKIEDGCLTLKTTIFHENGEALIESFAIPIPQGRNITQDFGSCLSYARRYSILSLFSLAQEDDDGVGSKPADKPQKPTKPSEAHAKLMEDVDLRLGNLEVLDWAEGVNFIPHKSSEAKLTKFMKLSDEEVLAVVNKYREGKHAA